MIGTFGLSLLLVPFMEGQDHGWPWWSIVLPLTAIPVFGCFLSHERRLSVRGGVPIIDVALFGNHRFVAGVIAIFLFYSAISSFFLSLTMLLQPGFGLSPLVAGAVFTPSALAFFAASLVGPKLAGLIGRKALLIGVALFWMALANLPAMRASTAPANVASDLGSRADKIEGAVCDQAAVPTGYRSCMALLVIIALSAPELLAIYCP